MAKLGRPKDEKNRKVILNFRVDKDTLMKVKLIARKKDIEVSDILRMILGKYLNKEFKWSA